MIIPVWVKPAAIVLAFTAAAYGGYHYRDVVAQRDTLKFQTAAQAKEADYTAQLQNIANQVETTAYANQQKHNKELADYRNTIKLLGGLYDTGASNSTPAGSTTSNSTATSGNRLSDEAAGFLLEQANLADQVVDQYLTCQKYVQKIHEVNK